MLSGRSAFAVMAALLVFLSCCIAGEEGGKIVVMSWNVQNLFDDVDDGTEYYEFDPENGKWNTDLFNRKAAALADVITAAVPGGPDVVLLQEVENANALDLLNDGYLKACGYRYSVFFPTEGSAVGCAVLSRLQILDARSHAVRRDGPPSGRNIAEIRLSSGAASGELRVYINHWKSKLGGAEATEPARRASAGLLRDLIGEAVSADPDLTVIAAGDFNESHDEYDRIGSAYPTAILPSSLAQAAGSRTDCICFSGRQAVSVPSEGLLLFNPWTETGSGGSYFYDGNWETIDQFFISGAALDGKGLEYESFGTAALDFNTDSGGNPLGWQNATGSGCSDHFPIFVEFVIAEPQ